jgi:RHS repeat-associated protein
MYFEARYYDPLSTRFISPDPLFAAEMEKCIESIVECNLYQYTGNNPIVRVDQTGEFWHIVIGAGVGALFSTADYFISTDVKDWDGGKLAAKAVSGALVGGATAANPMAGIVRGLAKAGGAGFIGGVADDMIDKGKLEIDQGSLEKGGKSALSNAFGFGVGKGLESKAKAWTTVTTPAKKLYPTTSTRPDNSVTTYVVSESAKISASSGAQQTIQDTAGAAGATIVNKVHDMATSTGDKN